MEIRLEVPTRRWCRLQGWRADADTDRHPDPCCGRLSDRSLRPEEGSRRSPGPKVVAEAEDGAEAVEKALSEDIDLVILDVSMPRMTGIQAAAELHKRKPELKTLMLSMHDSEQFLFEALKAGPPDTC